MNTIAFEVVPTSMAGGVTLAQDHADKVKALLLQYGLYERINSLMIPYIIPEDGERPVSLDEKMDPLEFSNVMGQHMPTSVIVSQVTVFSTAEELEIRMRKLRDGGINRVVFVGIPRDTGGRPIVGPYPNEALHMFREKMPERGAILIPTRPDEKERFLQKLQAGANFALTQLLFSNQIVDFLDDLDTQEHPPEIILSFGYVPKIEDRIGLIRWLIRDTPVLVQQEMEEIARLAMLPFKKKKTALLELYKKVVDGASTSGFPIGLHFECPYGLSDPPLETFRDMLEIWRPD